MDARQVGGWTATVIPKMCLAVLDNIMLYWCTASAVSSGRIVTLKILFTIKKCLAVRPGAFFVF